MKQNQIECPVCSKNNAVIDRQLGVLPCRDCLDRQKWIIKPNQQIEFTSNEIKENRRKYFKSIIQPYRDGMPSKEYADAYPEQASKMFKKYKKNEIKNVWGDITPKGGIERTK